jgi:hypothetical protein
MLPSDFPKWRSVYSYFEIWSEEKDGQKSILDQALKKWLERPVPAMVGQRKQAFA